jgi:hypothetical protein
MPAKDVAQCQDLVRNQTSGSQRRLHDTVVHAPSASRAAVKRTSSLRQVVGGRWENQESAREFKRFLPTALFPV